METIVNENQLIAEIEKLREQFPNTQDLYREVCTLLFFRYGTAPTANKLYQLVRKGSMSAPAEALNKFWSDLREKSRVRIEHPDLPDALKNAAGELTATLWSAAQAAAADSIASLQSEAKLMAIEAQNAMKLAQSQLENVQNELDKSRHENEQARQEITRLQQQWAAERATRESTEAQLSKAQTDIASHQEAQDSARRYFAEEMEKLRTAAQLDKERFVASERSFLQEIEREKQITVALQKELEHARQEASRMQELHRAELAAIQNQVGDLRQLLGSLEGRLQSTNTERDQLANDMRTTHMQHTAALAKQTQLALELETWRQRAELAEKTVTELRAKAETRTKRSKISLVEPAAK